MDAIDKILLLAGLAASAVVTSGWVVCFLVWFGGSRWGRASEVCPPTDKS
jgi:hypothetical protein